MEQLNLQLGLDDDDPLVQLLTPRDILSRITRGELSRFKEDRRVEFKQNLIHFDELVKYYSMFSNTAPDGGIILIGVDKNGSPSGCTSLSAAQINKLESFHLQYCPAAKPEHSHIPCTVNGLSDFIVAIYVPYLNRLCETNKGEA